MLEVERKTGTEKEWEEGKKTGLGLGRAHREVLKALRVLFRDSNPDTQLTSKNKGYQACSEYTPSGFSLKKRAKS